MFELFMYVYSCNALSARFFVVDRALNSYFIIMIMIMICYVISVVMILFLLNIIFLLLQRIILNDFE